MRAKFTGYCLPYVAKRKNTCSSCMKTIVKGNACYKATVEGRPNPRYMNNEECSVIICAKCGAAMQAGKWITRA